MMSNEEAEELRKRLLEELENLPEEQQEQVEQLKKQIEKATKEQLEQFIKSQQAASQAASVGGGCIFCQIIGGKLETIRIYEDSDIIAVLDIYPASPGHILVMPKEHYESIEEVPDALLNKIFLFIKGIVPSFLKITKAKAFNIFIAQGESAGQFVKHFSINLIPRHEKDTIAFAWNKLKVNKEELEVLGEKLRKEAAKEIKSRIEAEREREIKERQEREESETEKIMKHVKKRMP